MALISLIELSIIWYAFSDQKPLERLRIPLLIVAALCIGRIFLALWYFIFHYTSPLGRIEFITNRGLAFFYSRFEQNSIEFWLTPGIPFLLINASIILIYIYKRNFLLAASILCTLAMSYFALFISIDGLRVFAVISCASYVLILSNTIGRVRTQCATKP